MKLNDSPSARLVERRNRRGLGGFLRVALATPWASMEEALAQADVDEMSPEAVQVFLDLSKGGEKGVRTYEDTTLTEYLGKFSPTAKSFLIAGGRSAAFKEYAVFCTQWMLLQ
jgi:hypothetical protein